MLKMPVLGSSLRRGRNDGVPLGSGEAQPFPAQGLDHTGQGRPLEEAFQALPGLGGIAFRHRYTKRLGELVYFCLAIEKV